jgi:hypothetical protein
MNDQNENFDNDVSHGVTKRFSLDLGRLFSPGRPNLFAVDRAVAEAARLHLAMPVRRLLWVRWAAPLAAAAAIALGCVLWFGHSPAGRVQTAFAAEDIDHNGRVDIVDAFQLARHIESGHGINPLWDFNGDGVIDRKDVDEVASAAVALDKGV